MALIDLRSNVLSRHTLRAVRPLVCPYWGPDFESWCRHEDKCDKQCRDFGVFLPFLQCHPTNILHIPIPPLHVILYYDVYSCKNMETIDLKMDIKGIT